MDEEDGPVFLLGLVVGIAVTLAAVAIRHAHQRQWHVRELRRIRALPERAPAEREPH